MFSATLRFAVLASAIALAACNSAEAPAAGPTASGPVHQPWAPWGSVNPGDTVLYSATGGKTWRKGVVTQLGDPADQFTRGMYLIEGDLGRGWYDRHFVVAPEPAPFWTGFFIGDWDVSIPVSMNYKTDGRKVYQVVSGGKPLPPLRISADGRYAWRVDAANGASRVIEGRWIANPEGPGVILQAAEQGADWLVYNNTDNGELTRFGRSEVNLSAECCTYLSASRIPFAPAATVQVGDRLLAARPNGSFPLVEVLEVSGTRARVRDGYGMFDEWVERSVLRKREE